MKRWIDDDAYNARPWFMMAGGAMLCLGSMLWSMVDGDDWTLFLSTACVLGAGFIVCGGGLLLRRQKYRARSKWRRSMLR